MEGWENKMLGEKLNSLQDLPIGYTPDLLSKWEIVEASLPTSKKRRLAPLLIRWSVAAAVLITVGLVWVNTGKKDAASVAVKEQIVAPTVVFQQKQPTETESFSTNAHPLHLPQPSHLTTNTKAKPAGELTYQAPARTITIPVSEDTNRGDVSKSSGSNVPVALSNDSLYPITTQQADAATAMAENKPAKKKIYQRDFNDGVLAMDTGFSPTARQHFSIQLNPFSRKTDDGEQPIRRLQLKQAL